MIKTKKVELVVLFIDRYMKETYKKNFKRKKIIYKDYLSNKISNKYGAAIVVYHSNGKIKEEHFMENGRYIEKNNYIVKIERDRKENISAKHYYISENFYFKEIFNKEGVLIESSYYKLNNNKEQKHSLSDKHKNTEYFLNGKVKKESWYINGKKERTEMLLPVSIDYSKDGTIISKRFSDDIHIFCRQKGWLVSKIDKEKKKELIKYLMGQKI